MTHRYDVYGIGNALVDIQARVEDAMIADISSEHFPGVITKGTMHLVNTSFQGHLLRVLERETLHTVAGGSACNTILGVAYAGCRAKYAGKVGDDVHGAFFVDDLHSLGVDFDVPMGHDDTGTCVILVTPDAQRTMFTHLGISTALTPDDINEDDIRQSRWIYIEGYLWDADGPKAASIKAMEIAKRHGVRVAYTFSDRFCVERAREDFLAFTKHYVDLVFCNRDEAYAFACEHGLEKTVQMITGLGTGVAITDGVNGSVIAWNGERLQVPSVKTTAIDTTGAGDLYAAGVLAGICQGKSMHDAGALGAKLAAQVIAVQGARLQVA
ncbi:MAG: adenosine kinase [Deltaproteobacteria bacterium]|nr:adenosine kinase [Deltaproteobacteria bacterium]